MRESKTTVPDSYLREFEDEKAYQRGTLRARNRNAYTALSFLRSSDISG